MSAYADTFKYSTGTPHLSSSGLFVLNPVEIDWQYEVNYNLVDVMDGEAVRQRPIHDNRVRKMIWKNWRIDLPKVINMVNILDKLEGSAFWFIDGTLGYFPTWTKCRGINVSKKFRAGGGKPRWREIVFEFIVIDSNWKGY